ncbi:MAG: pimeloyl-ACP methyl esterase BioG family protein [Rikenellaceae bacterium]
MVQKFLSHKGTERLILIFAGWGMDENLCRDIALVADHDSMICYEYSNLEFEISAIEKYSEVVVYAWSMGVWAAATVLPNSPTINVISSTAINGTHSPRHADYGINPEIFDATLANISEGGMRRFNRRMCNSKRELIADFESHAATSRTLESLTRELQAIKDAIISHKKPEYRWSRIVIGRGDLIFVAENQMRSWEAEGQSYTILEDAAHYIPMREVIK